jgi:hypothetical protein
VIKSVTSKDCKSSIFEQIVEDTLIVLKDRRKTYIDQV